MISNWAGNVRFSPARVSRPTSVPELQQVVAGSDRARVLGTGHSFNRIADTAGTLLRLDALPRVIEVDRVARVARLSGGLRYADLRDPLRAAGLALPNTGSLPHISVAGAVATGTHGSGTDNRVLATQVRSLTLVLPSGDLMTVDVGSRPDDFDGFPISLGRLGVVVELELRLVPSFEVAQTVVEDVDVDRVGDDLMAVLSSAYSVSIFTPWSADGAAQVWVKDLVGPEARWGGDPLWGGRPADRPRHPIAGMPVEHATVQLGEPGPWDERLPHFRREFVPSTGAELQSEYFVAAEHAGRAWHELRAMASVLAPVVQIGEVRAIAPDSLWLSPTRGEPTVAFHFTWIPDAAAVHPVVSEIERRLAPLEARPHWAKVFSTPADRLALLHPTLDRFRALVGELDPQGTFGNADVDHWLGLRSG